MKINAVDSRTLLGFSGKTQPEDRGCSLDKTDPELILYELYPDLSENMELEME